MKKIILYQSSEENKYEVFLENSEDCGDQRIEASFMKPEVELGQASYALPSSLHPPQLIKLVYQELALKEWPANAAFLLQSPFYKPEIITL